MVFILPCASVVILRFLIGLRQYSHEDCTTMLDAPAMGNHSLYRKARDETRTSLYIGVEQPPLARFRNESTSRCVWC